MWTVPRKRSKSSADPRRSAPPIERRLAEGYAWRRAGDPYKALSAYTDALACSGEQGSARRRGRCCRRRAVPTARRRSQEPHAVCRGPGRGDAGRWGTDTRPSDPAQRFDATDAAIARLDGLLAALSPPPAEAAARRRLRLDRLVALRDRVRMQEVVKKGRALRSGGPLPPYAEEAHARCLACGGRKKRAPPTGAFWREARKTSRLKCE